jgi:broad specificity phosphatase PhoE
MAELPRVFLVRHGETAWSKTGQHTGRRDIPLTPDGERMAGKVGDRLRGEKFTAVFSSPLQRAARTCQLAGFGGVVEILPDLLEWDYGQYDGLTIAEIRAKRPDWLVLRDGCPGGESPEQVAARADRVIGRLRSLSGDALCFAHGHLLRVLAMRWLGLPLETGGRFKLSAGSVGILSYEHTLDEPAIALWNDVSHLSP